MSQASHATAYETYRSTRHFASLDGLRCLCILPVIWHHSARPDLPIRLDDMGFLGVGMFFVLSGYLIVTLLLRERDSTGEISLKDYYARRTIRIFPIYYLMLAALGVYYAVLKPGSPELQTYLNELPYYLTYTSNWIHTETPNQGILWSLATEEQFYIFWPLIEKLLRPRWALGVLFAVIGVNQLVNFGVTDAFFAKHFGESFNTLSVTESTFTPIALGVLLAHVLHHKRSFNVMYGLLASKWSSAVALLALLGFIELTSGDISGWQRLMIHILMVVMLASLVVRENHVLRRVLTLKIVVRLGAISYGMYLYHMWCAHFAREGYRAAGLPAELSQWIMPVLNTLVTTIVAEMSFRIVEAPILKLKKRFATGRHLKRGDR